MKIKRHSQKEYKMYLKDWMINSEDFDGKFKTSAELWEIAMEIMPLNELDTTDNGVRAVRNLFSHKTGNVWQNDPDMEIFKINGNKWAVRPKA